MAQIINCQFDGKNVHTANFTLTQGISPGTGTITFAHTKITLPKFSALIFQDGHQTIRLEPIYTMNPQIVEDADQGQLLTCAINDRRFYWKWGGITGRWNNPTAGGVANQEYTLTQLIDMCMAALGEVNYTLYNIPAVYPPVTWEFDNPATAMQDICDKFALRIGYHADNRIIVCPYNYVNAFVPGSVSTQDYGINNDILPMGVYLVGGRKVHQIDFEKLVPVGEDTDGSIKAINDLSYKPEKISWEKEIVHMFSNVSGDRERELASKCVFKWYSIDWANVLYSADTVLPLLTNIVETITTDQGLTEFDKPYIVGEKTIWDGVKFKNIANGVIEDGYSIDKKTGIVKFNKPVYKAKQIGATAVEFQTPKLTLVAAYEVNNGNADDFEYWYEPIIGGTELAVVHKEDSLVPYYLDDKLDPENAVDLDNYANVQMLNLLFRYQAKYPEERVYEGIYDQSAYGEVASVNFSASPAGAETTVQRYLEIPELNMPNYDEKMNFRLVKERLQETLNKKETERGKAKQKTEDTVINKQEKFEWDASNTKGVGLNVSGVPIPASSVAIMTGFNTDTGYWSLDLPIKNNEERICFVHEGMEHAQVGMFHLEGVNVVRQTVGSSLNAGDRAGVVSGEFAIKKMMAGNLIVEKVDGDDIYVRKVSGAAGSVRLGVIKETLGGDKIFKGDFYSYDDTIIESGPGANEDIVVDELEAGRVVIGKEFNAVFQRDTWWCVGIYDMVYSSHYPSSLDLISSAEMSSEWGFSSEEPVSSKEVRSSEEESSGRLSSAVMSSEFPSSEEIPFSSEFPSSFEVHSSGYLSSEEVPSSEEAPSSQEVLSSAEVRSSGVMSSQMLSSEAEFSSEIPSSAPWSSGEEPSSGEYASSEALFSSGKLSSGEELSSEEAGASSKEAASSREQGGSSREKGGSSKEWSTGEEPSSGEIGGSSGEPSSGVPSSEVPSSQKFPSSAYSWPGSSNMWSSGEYDCDNCWTPGDSSDGAVATSWESFCDTGSGYGAPATLYYDGNCRWHTEGGHNDCTIVATGPIGTGGKWYIDFGDCILITNRDDDCFHEKIDGHGNQGTGPYVGPK